MKITARIAFTACLTLILCGCATQVAPLQANLSPSPTAEELSSAPSGKCPLTIYRNQTSFKAISFDFDLPAAFINDMPVGKLRVGQTHCANVKPGRYQVAVKEPNIFGPVTKADAIIEVKEGQPLFLRFAMDFGGIAVIGTAVSASTQNRLQLVTEAAWEERR
jgi:hypothetical protein